MVCAAACALAAIWPAPTRAQEHWPMGAVARFTGEDISFEGSTLGAAIPGGTSFYVSSGTVLTVHSGDARLTLPGGGIVDICGPAKLTVLESNAAYTLALNFGRVHVRLADATQLRIFTPFVVAAPVSIAEEARDFTLGLDLNDAMCVFAAQGAAHLEDQFSSEGLTVPQLGEFFLSGEKLEPKAGPGGTCRCFRDESREARAAGPRFVPNAPNANGSAPPQAKPGAPGGVAPGTPAATAVVVAPRATSTGPASAAPPPAAAHAAKMPAANASKPLPPMRDARSPQLPPPAISDTLPRGTSVIPTVEAAEPPPPAGAETASAKPPAETPAPAAVTVASPEPPPAPAPAPPPAKQVSGNAPEADPGFNMPEHANEAPPVAAHVDGSAPEAPKLEPPVRVVMPPLTFSAASPAPPIDTNPQLVTLIRDARVSHDWVFTGHVVDTKAPAAAGAATGSAPGANTKGATKRRRRGILTMFKRFFGTSAPPPQ